MAVPKKEVLYIWILLSFSVMCCHTRRDGIEIDGIQGGTGIIDS